MIVSAALFALFAGCSNDRSGTTASTSDPAPNILVFTLDTLRADALGAYGKSPSPSPTIDGLTQQGYRFTRAYTVTPLTIPAHSSLWTSCCRATATKPWPVSAQK